MGTLAKAGLLGLACLMAAAGQGVTVDSGPVLTQSVSNPLNSCPLTAPTPASAFHSGDPVMTFWLGLAGLTEQSTVYFEFSYNGAPQPTISWYYPSGFQSGLNYLLCPSLGTASSLGGFGTNFAALFPGGGAGSWTLGIYIDGSSTPISTIPFTILGNSTPTTLVVSTTPVSVSGVPGSFIDVQLPVSASAGSLGVVASSSASWLSVENTGSTSYTFSTPFTISLLANLAGFAPGSYVATVTLTPQSPTANGPQKIQVTANVIAPSAAPATCNILPPASTFLRVEGYTELAPDVVIQCTGAPNLSTTVDIQLFANTNITSRLVGSTNSEALLLVNEPAVSTRQLGVNAFLAQLGASNPGQANVLGWSAIPVVIPASGNLTLRVSNIRIDTEFLGTSSTFGQSVLEYAVDLQVGGVFLFSQQQEIFANSLIGSQAPQSSNSLTGSAVGVDQRQCDDSGGALFTYSPSSTLNPSLPSGGVGQINFNVRFRELMPKGFSTLQDETGQTVPGLPTVGVATQGARLSLSFSNVPVGVQLFATTGGIGPNDSASAKATLVTTDSFGGGAFAPVTATASGVCAQNGKTAALAPISGDLAVWEITADDPAAFETLSFGIALSGNFNGFVFPQITAGLAPFYPGNHSPNPRVPEATLSVPRFIPGVFPTNLSIAEGLTFVGVTGGGQIPSQSITVQCPGGCTAPVATTSSGGNWLTAKVTASNTVAETLTVSVAVNGLSPGIYYGTITEGNSVSLTIVFNVVPANVDPGPIVTPIGLVFVALPGSGQTPAQTVTLYNITNSPITYTSTNPTGSGTIGASPVTVPISYNVAPQPPGTFSGDTHFTFSDGFQADVIGRVVVTPSGGGGANRPAIIAPSGCTPTALTVTVTSLGPQNNLGVGFAVPIDAEVKDSPCGNPVTAANVSATFSSEATTVQMSPDPITPGLYDGSWTPQTAATNAQITVTASASNLTSASQTVTRGVVLPSAGSQAPVISSGGVINVFSGQAVVSPGEAISIYGQNLSDQPYSPTGPLPLPPTLGPTKVFLQGLSLPLFYASSGLINALVPFNIPPGSYPMSVSNGAAMSTPVNVMLSGAGPGLYPNAIRLDGLPANAANPVHVGDEVVLYAVGLGPVAYAPGAGAAAPENPLASLVGSGLTVTIGGVPVPVIDYAGLTPDTAGLYQINVKVPVGVAPGTAQVVVTAAGVAAPAITLSVQ